MKIFFPILFFLTHFLYAGDLKHITIGKQDFSIITEVYDIYGSKGVVMKLYKEERNNDLTFVLSLTLKDNTGTCSDKSIQEGAYEINGTQMTLYSFWDRRGKAYDAPYGARITHYKLSDDLTMVKESSYLYIESERKNHNKESGMQYLFTSPNTEDEKAQLRSYIEDIERQYKGKFVYGDEAENLISEVKSALSREVEKFWK